LEDCCSVGDPNAVVSATSLFKTYQVKKNPSSVKTLATNVPNVPVLKKTLNYNKLSDILTVNSRYIRDIIIKGNCLLSIQRSISNGVFGKELKARGFEVHRTKKARFLIGINLEHAEIV